MRCQVVLINKVTNRRSLMPTIFSSRKKAIEWADAFVRSFNTHIADYEIKDKK